MDGHRASLRESRALAAVSIAFMGHFSGFPWANHFDLPGSESVFGTAQDPLGAGSSPWGPKESDTTERLSTAQGPSACAHATLSRDSGQRSGLCVFGITSL